MSDDGDEGNWKRKEAPFIYVSFLQKACDLGEQATKKALSMHKNENDG